MWTCTFPASGELWGAWLGKGGRGRCGGFLRACVWFSVTAVACRLAAEQAEHDGRCERRRWCCCCSLQRLASGRLTFFLPCCCCCCLLLWRRLTISAWTNKLITAKDHASIQVNIGHLNEEGIYTNTFTTFALAGKVRSQVRMYTLMMALKGRLVPTVA